MTASKPLAFIAITLLLSFAAALSTAPAQAQDAPSWVGPSAIDLISVQPNGRIYVKLAMSTPDLSCPGNIDGYLELNPSYPHFDKQYALLLAAHAANRTVRVYVSGCGHYPYAQNVDFY